MKLDIHYYPFIWGNTKYSLWEIMEKQANYMGTRIYEELDLTIPEAIDLVTDNDIIIWLTHCFYCVSLN